MSPTNQLTPPMLDRRRSSVIDGATVAAVGLVQAALLLTAPAVGHGMVAVRSLRGTHGG